MIIITNGHGCKYHEDNQKKLDLSNFRTSELQDQLYIGSNG